MVDNCYLIHRYQCNVLKTKRKCQNSKILFKGGCFSLLCLNGSKLFFCYNFLWSLMFLNYYSEGSNTKHWNTKSIWITIVLKFKFWYSNSEWLGLQMAGLVYSCSYGPDHSKMELFKIRMFLTKWQPFCYIFKWFWTKWCPFCPYHSKSKPFKIRTDFYHLTIRAIQSPHCI